MGKKGEMKEKKEEKGPLQAPMGLQGPPPSPPGFLPEGAGINRRARIFLKVEGPCFSLRGPACIVYFKNQVMKIEKPYLYLIKLNLGFNYAFLMFCVCLCLIFVVFMIIFQLE